MAEQRQIKYEGLKQRQSQLSIQPSGTVGTPSTPPQYNVASGNLKSANRHQQFAKALGVLNPALKNLAFSLAEGAKDDKIAAVKDKKLKLKEEELLGLELFQQHTEFFAPSENFPNGKLITKSGLEVDLSDRWNDETGKIQRGKGSPEETFKKLGITYGNYRDLTEYNLDNVRYWYNVGKARKLSKEFNETLVINKDTIARLKEDYEIAKEYVDEQGFFGPKGGKPFKNTTFAGYTEHVVNQSYEGLRMQLPEEVWHEIDIETGVNNLRKSYLEHQSNTLHNTFTRDYQERVVKFWGTQPLYNEDGSEKVLSLSEYIQWRDNNLKGIPIGGKTQADLNTIRFLRGKIENAKSLRELKRYNPEFLFETTYETIDPISGKVTTKSHPGIASTKNLSSPSIAAREAYDQKLGEFEEELEKKQEDQDEKRLIERRKNLSLKLTTLEAQIDTNPKLRGEHYSSLLGFNDTIIELYPEKHRTIFNRILDKINSRADKEEASEIAQKERDSKVNPETDRQMMGSLSQRITGVKQMGFFEDRGEEGKELNETGYEEELVKIEQDAGKALEDGDITSASHNSIIKEANTVRTDFQARIKEWKEEKKDSTKVTQEKNRAKRRGELVVQFYQNKHDLSANLASIKENSDLYTGEGAINSITNLVRALHKDHNDGLLKKAVVTDPNTAVSIFNQIKKEKLYTDQQTDPLINRINQAYNDEKLSNADWKWFTSLVKDSLVDVDSKFQDYNSMPGYTAERNRINNLLDTTKTMMIKGIGLEENIIKAHASALYAFEKGMNQWAISNKEDAIDPQKVADKAQELAESILSSNTILNEYAKSESEMDPGTVLQLNDDLWRDILKVYPNTKIITPKTRSSLNEKAQDQEEEKEDLSSKDISGQIYIKFLKDKDQINISTNDALEVQRMLSTFDNDTFRSFWYVGSDEEKLEFRKKATSDIRKAKGMRKGPFAPIPYGPDGEKEAEALHKFLLKLQMWNRKNRGE
tara:strand:+ start:2893 stop:5853 length:2961 start_codon:yes stop_codon:yes gene_type:complete